MTTTEAPTFRATAAARAAGITYRCGHWGHRSAAAAIKCISKSLPREVSR